MRVVMVALVALWFLPLRSFYVSSVTDKLVAPVAAIAVIAPTGQVCSRISGAEFGVSRMFVFTAVPPARLTKILFAPALDKMSPLRSAFAASTLVELVATLTVVTVAVLRAVIACAIG